LRDDFEPESDVDVLVEFHQNAKVGLIKLSGIEIELGELIGRKVDLTTPGFISIYFRDQVLSEAEGFYVAAFGFLSLILCEFKKLIGKGAKRPADSSKVPGGLNSSVAPSAPPPPDPSSISGGDGYQASKTKFTSSNFQPRSFTLTKIASAGNTDRACTERWFAKFRRVGYRQKS
jgi:hypothetical protein